LPAASSCVGRLTDNVHRIQEKLGIFYINVKNNPGKLPLGQMLLPALTINNLEFNAILFHESSGMGAAYYIQVL
jgi:hypothetical protein